MLPVSGVRRLYTLGSCWRFTPGCGTRRFAEFNVALVAYSKWYLEKLGAPRPEWSVFPAGSQHRPTRPPTSFKTVWARVKREAGVQGCWHDSRHTFTTDLAESGEASDETIQEMAGHVFTQMLKHYSHIRMEAKRRAVTAIEKPKPAAVSVEPAKRTR